jgi:hypothetical protein
MFYLRIVIYFSISNEVDVGVAGISQRLFSSGSFVVNNESFVTEDVAMFLMFLRGKRNSNFLYKDSCSRPIWPSVSQLLLEFSSKGSEFVSLAFHLKES